MKKSKIILIILSIIYVILSIYTIINSDSLGYNIILLTVIYIPYLLIIILNDGYFGKIISIGFCAIELITRVLSIITSIRLVINGYGTYTFGFIISLIVIIFCVLVTIAFIRLMKEKEIKFLKYFALLALLIVLIYQVISIFGYNTIDTVKVMIIKNVVFYIILCSYMFIEANSKAEEIQS